MDNNYIGRLLDSRYEILDLIGMGGMAVVYKARDNRLNRLVAIKILKDEYSENAEFRRRFHAESQAVAMLSHPNIVSVYDVSHADHLDYIVMELIEGITLKQYMEQKGQLGWREALHFSTQIAKALEHAHSRGIIHRDIKPHNIMLLKDGSVKVADFGIARISSSQNTLTREALGSVHYISPEQAKGAHVDYRTDIYSLGVVMYEMLTGRPPFDGDTPVSVAIQHINAKPTMLRELNPAIPEGLEQITMHAMAADLASRYASATQMLRDLEEFRKNPNITFDFSKPEGAIDLGRLINDPDYVLQMGKAQTPSHPHPSRPRPASDAQRASTQEAEKKEEKRSSRKATIVGVICIALALAGIGYFLYSYLFSDLFATTEEIDVPNFIGMNYDSLNAADYDFNIEVEAWKTSDTYGYGYILDQDPAYGRSVKSGGTVKLTVSSGAQTNIMPSLVNLPLADAQLYLKSINMTVNVEYRDDEDFTDGYIMETIPASGETLTEGQTVTLIVCKKETETVEMPNLVGKTLEEALNMIDAAGLSRGTLDYDEDSDSEKDTVLEQSVKAGEEVDTDTAIDLVVASGKVSEPIVTSLSKDMTISQGDSATVQIAAETDDKGSLSYAWYVSKGGSYENATLVSAEAEDNTTCTVDSSTAGVYYYFCKVVNTNGAQTAETDSDMIKVSVEERIVDVTKTIYVTIPSEGDTFQINVKIGGSDVVEPFEIEGSNGSQIAVSVTSRGTQIVDIYINGVLSESKTVDFS